MTNNYEGFIHTYKRLLEEEMLFQIEKLEAPHTIIEAMKYSLSAGGKRIRPILLFAVIEALGENPEIGLKTACALEMIHTYSLIHDDLPSMDDDDLRRGKPTNHKVFGEAMAILAGDGLLTLSFQLIAEDQQLNDQQKVMLIQLLSKSAGPEGMVAGQVADMEAENKELEIAELEYIHQHKTGKLLSFSVMAGALIGNATEKQLTLFNEFSSHLGLAFQISDDILDVVGDESIIGKPVGSDHNQLKSTYPSLLSLDGAKTHLYHHIEEAKTALVNTGLNIGLLQYLTNIVGGRDR